MTRCLAAVMTMALVGRVASGEGECDPVNASEFSRVSRVRCIVTGLENSGTTILSQLIMAAPGVLGGFECGLLNARSPSEFPRVHPFYEWMSKGPETRHWGISKENVAKLCRESRCHAEFYAGLFQYSPILVGSSEIIDKTPRYIYDLASIMRRSPGIPVVVISKPETDQLKSWAKRHVTGPGATARYRRGMLGLDLALSEFPERILRVNLTELKRDPNGTMKRVYDFIGLVWRQEYVTLDDFNAKFSSFGATSVPALEVAHEEEEEEEGDLSAEIAQAAPILTKATTVVEWLGSDELLSDQSEFIQVVAEISLNKVGFMTKLQPDEWRKILQERNQPEVLINTLLDDALPSLVDTLGVDWP